MSAVRAIKPFSPIVNRRIVCCDALQFYEGPVRSGKTLASLMSLCYYIATHDVRTGIMSGDSVGSVVRNCIKSELGFLDLCPGSRLLKRNNVDQIVVPTDHGEVVIYLFGGGKANSDDSLRGLTADFWYADEITKHHLNFVNEAMARLAASDHPFMLWTSNPDTPAHPLYREYTDKFLHMSPEDKEAFGGYHEFHFRLEDNPLMTKEKIAALSLRYTGVEYRRKVLGERCIAEGLIYPFFGPRCIGYPPADVRVQFAAIDFGTVHPTAMGWYGRSPSTRKWYKIRDWVASPQESATMTVGDYYAKFVEITDELGGIPRHNVTIDYGGGGEALVRQFERNRWMPQNPDKSVLDGISATAHVLNAGILMISPDCKPTIRSLEIYHWDEAASQRGEDKPVKQDDDPADETRYAVSTFIEHRLRRDTT